MKKLLLFTLFLIGFTALHAADYDAHVNAVRTDHLSYTMSEDIECNVIVKNRGEKVIERLHVKLTIGGKTVSEETVTANIEPTAIYTYKKTVAHQLEEPSNSVEVATEVSIVGDNIVEEDLSNNTKTRSIKVTGEYVARKVVIEEATGFWCGYCPRAIYGMNYMSETYPDDFIGIAVHGNDQLQVGEYAAGLNRQYGSFGYPSAWINRTIGCGSEKATFEGSYEEQKKKLSEVAADVSATLDDKGKITATLHAHFFTADTTADYRAVFVLVENGVTGYGQYNNYSGTPDMPPFSGAGDYVEAPFDHIAMGIYPSYSGTKGSFPAKIRYNHVYTYTQTFNVPYKVQNVNNLEIVGMIIDKNGRIANADKKRLGEVTAIDTPVLDNASPSRYFDLSGRAIEKPAQGIYIERMPNGKSVKRMVK